jgi:tripartite-type tricarboxylate transporter receptor subunit TctC
MNYRSAAAALVLTGLLGPAFASAQEYPSRPVHLVVPFPPGGGVDTLARIVAPKLQAGLGQAFIVENKSGAAGTIGVDYVAKAPPDGYALVVGSPGNMSVAPSLNPKLPYKPLTDFAPIAMGVRIPTLLVVHPSFPANNVQELIAAAKANPGKYNFSSGGQGTALHLAGELFKIQAGVDIRHIPYKGTSPAITDLLAGQVNMMFSDPSVLQHVKAGKLRALAQTTATRAASIPDLPTIAESGVPGYSAANWYGFFAPAGTPAAVVQKLNGAFVKALQQPDVIAVLRNGGMDVAPSSPAELGAFLKEDIERWAAVVKQAGIEDK